MIKGLFPRFLMIIIIPIILLQFIGLYIFYERHWLNVSRRLEANLLGEIATIDKLIDISNFKDVYRIAQLLNFDILEVNAKDFNLYNNNQYNFVCSKTLVKQVENTLSKSVSYCYITDKNDIILNINYKANKFYNLKFSAKKLYSSTVYIFLIWMLSLAVLLIIVSVIFMKNQVRAILELAVAAEEFGKNHHIGKFKPSGAREVRIVGKAFLKMKARIERQIRHRTQLLAHISHDLKTPLTRIRLNTEFLKSNKSSDNIKIEIKLMENIVNEYLNFAKEDGNEDLIKINIVEQLKNLIISYNSPKILFKCNIEFCYVTLKSHALNRAMNNLIDNALKYCINTIKIKLRVTSKYWFIFIDDDGLGIPSNHYKKVFQPFFKINKNSSGFGLGLAAVKSIIYNHGGKIKLSKSSLGGLRVMLKIPF